MKAGSSVRMKTVSAVSMEALKLDMAEIPFTLFEFSIMVLDVTTGYLVIHLWALLKSVNTGLFDCVKGD